MSYKDFDPFNYMDIKPQNYKYKQNMSPDLDLITKTLENITNDWKERESSLQFIGRIVKGNQGHSDFFIKYFNSKLSTSLEIQLSDLRSTVMKEACRITSLCARELGLYIEQGITQLLTHNCLFKIAGSANQVISESASKCILNILRYVNSIKVISNICENKIMKANSVRILCAQSLVNIMSFYDTGMIIKAKNVLEEAIKVLLVDANAEVRATTRKSFILYKNRFNEEGEKIFAKLGKNVQKQILEDEKNFGNINISVKNNKNENFVKKVNEIIEENLDNIDYIDLIKNKPKTPEYNNLFKRKKSLQDFSKRKKKYLVISTEKNRKSSKIKRNTFTYSNGKEKGKEKKEETVKYINVDDDDIAENDDDVEEDKKEVEESRDVNMILNYNNTNSKRKNSNKMSFTKKNPFKNNDNSQPRDNYEKKEYQNIVNYSIKAKIPKDSKKPIEINTLSQSQNINSLMDFNKTDENKIIDELINNQDNKNVANSNRNTDNNYQLSKTISNLNTERGKKPEATKKTKISITRITEKTKNQSNENKSEKNESNKQQNSEKSKIIKKFNTKYDKLNAIKNFSTSIKGGSQSKNLKDKKTNEKSKEKIKVIGYEISKNKTTRKGFLKNIIADTKINNHKTIDYDDKKINDININDNDEIIINIPNKTKKKKNENIKTINIALEEENNLEEEIDAVIYTDNNRDRTYSAKTNNNKKNSIINNFNKYYLNKKDNKKANENKPNNNKNKTDKTESKNVTSEYKSENNNYQELYNELSNTNVTSSTKNEEQKIKDETEEQRVIAILDKLDNLINQSEKLIFFQYLFNHFNMILKEIKTFSQSTIKRYIDIHIENLKENEPNLIEQVLKNLMRMIFYLNDIFSTYDIELILKILLFSINDTNIKTLKKLSYDLLEIIKKKCDNEELFQSVYSLLGEYNSNYDDCYEFMYLLIPSCDKILKNINYFKQVFRLICLTDVNSKKVGKIIDILYRNYRNNFNQAFDEESQENKNNILTFMEKLNSLYFREFKSTHENELKNPINNNKINNESNVGNNQINSSLIQKQEQKNNNIMKTTESDDISLSKEILNNKISETNNTVSNNLKPSTNKSNNIILSQSTKNNNNINTINTNLNGNNIISINNSNNNNIIITNKLPEELIPSEIQTSIKNNDLEQYMFYLQKHKSYIPEFILLLSNKKYSEPKYVLTLLNFIKNILDKNEFFIDLNTCINLLIKQMIHLYNTNKNNKKIVENINNILSDMPIYLNSEKCLSLMAKYLTSDTDISTLEILILSLENFGKNYKQKVEGINREVKPLQNLLNFFIFEIFNLLKHQNNEIRKRALYCCLEIYTTIGKEFEPLVEKLPNAQQNLIRLYMKKRIG